MTDKQRAKQLEKEAKAAEKLKKEIERTESLMVQLLFPVQHPSSYTYRNGCHFYMVYEDNMLSNR